MDPVVAQVSQRSRQIPPFLVMDVLERAMEMARAGEDVIHLEVGEPDFDTPANIVEAGMKAMRSGKTHYTPSTGIPEFFTESRQQMHQGDRQADSRSTQGVAYGGGGAARHIDDVCRDPVFFHQGQGN